MKTKIQMQVAKHMLAVWTNVNDPDSLNDAYAIINSCWPYLSRRVLRTWVKALHQNPERYEYTGYAFKSLKLVDHFTDEEIIGILATVQNMEHGSAFDDIIRSIIHHKYVYGMNTQTALEHGIAVYLGSDEPRFHRRYRPAKPVLKPCK